jgi:hypothetical protein
MGISKSFTSVKWIWVETNSINQGIIFHNFEISDMDEI